MLKPALLFKVTLCVFSAIFTLPSYASLIITAVYDGPLSGGVPKGVELYVVSDIPDLSRYSLGGANNGGGSDGEEFTFPADAALAGTFIYVASESTGFNNFFGFLPDYTSSAMSINGDDAIELFADGVVVDLFGDINLSGSGQGWDYLDGWAYRQSGRTATNTFSEADWLYSGSNALDGETNNQSALLPIPLASYSPNDDGGPELPNIVINEIDSDTPSTDTLEFIELYDGGVGNSSLDEFVVVLFNGNGDSSYQAFDLDGLTTNAEGYFVLGNPGVANLSLDIGVENIIQNGADAVALYHANASDFPNGTAITTENLIDAMVYGTNDADDVELLSLLNPGQGQVNESANNGSAVDSNQRCPNGLGDTRNTDAYVQANPTPGQANDCPSGASLRLISEIQGTPDTQGSNSFGETDVSPLIGEQVIVEAIVVGDFQNNDADNSRNLSGFYLQEQTSDEDGDSNSSEGIFIFDDDFGVDVNLGDLVRVSGTVDQYFGETQIDQITSVEILANNMLSNVTPAIVSLLSQQAVTLNQNSMYQPDLEAYEGMLVSFSEELTITEQFQLDRFNEIKLVAGERPLQFTQNNFPDSQLFDLFQQSLGARRITYDDGLNIQNANISNLDGFANYAESNAKRMGDIVSNLTGVLDYKWSGNSASGATWRVRSHSDGTNVFTSNANGNSPNPRPILPNPVSGNLKIASYNVLNFFTTIDEANVLTAAGHDPRGADSIEEFDRQLLKLTNALLALDADVVGLVEIENEFDNSNDGSTAVEVLVNTLNQQLGATVYDYVYPGQTFVGTDAIAVAIIYKTAVLNLAEDSVVALLDDTVAASLPIFSGHDFSADPIFNGIATNRVPLAASFTHLTSGEIFTVIVNHFKSKGASDLTDTANPNFDQFDGAGFWNQRRLNAAIAIDAWLDTNPTNATNENVVILGDLNAYAQEQPVQYLLSNGFNNVEDENAYSYVFDGQLGTLDYLLVSDSLWQNFNEAQVWHINADEADALDYNLDFDKDPSYFDANTATRNSDHDPVIAGFNLEYVPTSPSDLINVFQYEVENGAIRGIGYFPLLQHIRLAHFSHYLFKAQYFYDKDLGFLACLNLNKALIFSDGEIKPADLITGNGVNNFNELITKVIIDAGCN